MAVCTHALAALVLIHLETPLLLQIAHVVLNVLKLISEKVG